MVDRAPLRSGRSVAEFERSAEPRREAMNPRCRALMKAFNPDSTWTRVENAGVGQT